MNVASIIVVIATCLICLRKKNRQFNLMLEMIWLGLFINMGGFFGDSLNSFTRELFVTIVLIIMTVFERNIKILKSVLIVSGVLLGVVILGDISLLINLDQPNVAPMDVTYDQIVLEGAYLQKAVFSYTNIGAFGVLFFFVLSLLICSNYFRDKEYVERIIEFLEKSCMAFFCLILLETVMVNIFNFDNYRTIMMTIFGVDESAKIYSFSTVRFLGLNSAFGFYSEPSYVSGPLLVFYLVNYINEATSFKKLVWFFISFLVAILSGSTNCILILCFGVVVLIKMILINKEISLTKRVWTSGLIGTFAISFMIVIISNNLDLWLLLLGNISEKLEAYISLTSTSNSSTISGYIRSYGNSVCYEVLITNPIFGVGLGTTRGFGMIPSVLASYGILGSIILVIYYKNLLYLRICKQNVILFVVLMLMLTSLFNIWQTYSAFVIALLICFNRTLHLQQTTSDGDLRQINVKR